MQQPKIVAQCGNLRIQEFANSWRLQQQCDSRNWKTIGNFSDRDSLVMEVWKRTGIFSTDLCGLPSKPGEPVE